MLASACIDLHVSCCVQLDNAHSCSVFSCFLFSCFCLSATMKTSEATCVLLSAGHELCGTEVESDTAYIRNTLSVSHTAFNTCCHIVRVCHTSIQPQNNMFTAQRHLLLFTGREHS